MSACKCDLTSINNVSDITDLDMRLCLNRSEAALKVSVHLSEKWTKFTMVHRFSLHLHHRFGPLCGVFFHTKISEQTVQDQIHKQINGSQGFDSQSYFLCNYRVAFHHSHHI